MAFEEQLPQWENEGTQPPQSKRVEGWLPNEKPPASWFNWLFGRTYRVLKELQEKAALNTDLNALDQRQTNHENNKNNPHNVTKDQVGLGNVDNVQQIPMSQKGQPNGVATLDDTGKVPSSQLPDIASPVTSVNGKTGDVQLTASDVGAPTAQQHDQLEQKVDAHLADKANPHGVTTEQVNYIEAKHADELPSTYPRGVTTFFVTGFESGYPGSGTVLTYCYNQNRIVQHFTSLSGIPYYRVGVSNQWGEWRRLLNDDGSTFSTASVNYYVDVNGDDENDGSSQNPFRTIAKAVSMLPSTILRNHNIRIYLGEGVWDEEVNINGINVLGRLEIRGTTTNPSNHVIDRLSVSNVLGEAWFLNFSTKKAIPYGRGSLEFSASSPHMYVENVEMIGATDGSEKGQDGSINLLADKGSVVYVTNCTMSNRRYGIRSNWSSRVFSRDNTGINNDFGVAARWGGIVQTYGTQPTGTTDNYSVDSGGIVVKPSGVILGD